MKIRLVQVLAAGVVLSFAAAPARPQNAPPRSEPRQAHSDVDGLALTPPMGWYPWNIFGEEPQNEKLIKEIVDALVATELKTAGYSYVGPDEGICFSRGPDGKLTSNLARYPSGRLQVPVPKK